VPCSGQTPSGPKALSADDPRIAQTALERANQLLRTGEKAEAIVLIETTLKQFPRDPQMRFLRAVLHAEGGERPQAIALLEQITQDFPELPEPYNNLAVLHSQMGNVDLARRALEDAVRALPGYALAQQNLGDIYLQLAARAYDLATRAGPAAAAAPAKRLELIRDLIKKLD
jgi:tetratricopeptide (TPR) repeat protein